MPYTSTDQVPGFVPAHKARAWMDAWNTAYAKAILAGESKEDAEKLAFIAANKVAAPKDAGRTNGGNMERRTFKAFLRAESTSSGSNVLRGYAARYGVRTTILNSFHELLAAGAFKAALQRGDETMLLVDHAGQPMARTKNGTLKLSEDAKGLAFSAQLPNTTAAADLYEQVRVGNLDECSFAFALGRGDDTWDDSDPDCEDDDCNLPLRTINTLRLFDVSVVGRPAYPQTSISTAFTGTDVSSENIAYADDDDGDPSISDPTNPWYQANGVVVSAEVRAYLAKRSRSAIAKEALNYGANLFRAQIRATRTLAGGQ